MTGQTQKLLTADQLRVHALHSYVRTFHEHHSDLFHELESGDDDDDGEDEGDDGVNEIPLGVEVEDHGGDEDAHAHDEVADHVPEGGADVHVAPTGAVGVRVAVSPAV